MSPFATTIRGHLSLPQSPNTMHIGRRCDQTVMVQRSRSSGICQAGPFQIRRGSSHGSARASTYSSGTAVGSKLQERREKGSGKIIWGRKRLWSDWQRQIRDVGHRVSEGGASSRRPGDGEVCWAAGGQAKQGGAAYALVYWTRL